MLTAVPGVRRDIWGSDPMKFLAAATVAAGLMFAGAASAAQVYLVEAWTHGPVPSASNLADPFHVPGGPATATFTWTGDINWSDTSAQNHADTGGIASNFLDGYGLQASNYSGTKSEADFLNSSLTIAGDEDRKRTRLNSSH